MPLTEDEATRIVSRHLKRAASSKDGQLDAEQSGILAVGGFHLGPGGLDVLEAAAKTVLAGQKGRKPHLVAIVASELSYAFTQVVDERGNEVQGQLQPQLENRLVPHESYGGDLGVQDGPVQTTRFQPQPVEGPPQNRAERRRAQREAGARTDGGKRVPELVGGRVQPRGSGGWQRHCGDWRELARTNA